MIISENTEALTDIPMSVREALQKKTIPFSAITEPFMVRRIFTQLLPAPVTVRLRRWGWISVEALFWKQVRICFLIKSFLLPPIKKVSSA